MATRGRKGDPIRYRQTKSGPRWDVFYREGRGRSAPQRTKTFTSERSAQVFLEQLRRRRELGAHAPSLPSDELVSAWLLEWMLRGSGRWAPATSRTYRDSAARWIIPYVGAMSLRDFGPEQVARWFADIRGEGCPVSSANAAIRTLQAALGEAVRAQKLPSNPVRLPLIPTQAKRPRALMPVEVERIRAKMPEARDRAIVTVMAYFGLRPSETFALRCSDLVALGDEAEFPGVLEVRRAWVREGELRHLKTYRARDVNATPTPWADLTEWRDQLAPACDFFFTTTFDLAPPSMPILIGYANWYRRVWRKACDEAKVQAAPYDCRHTWASLLINAGEPLTYVADQLGDDKQTVIANSVHLFDRARLRPNADPEELIIEARQQVADEKSQPSPAPAIRNWRRVKPAASDARRSQVGEK